ncbi:WD repeat-containing protein 49-like isoform X2 [Liolophura sinensis]
MVTMDVKLENRLNIKDLEALQEAFMAEGDGYDNKLTLTKDQFCVALSKILTKGSHEEFAELFDKIDVTKEGYVDWDKFASHMLLEFYEKDDRVKSTQVPQWKDLRTLPSPHKEIIQSVSYLKNTSRYIAISKEGCVSMWGNNMRIQRVLKTGTDSCKARDLWVTHFVPLQNINKIALSFTSKEIAFYDLSTKLEFNCQYKVQGLEYTPLCLDYWSNPNNVNEAIIVWGDTGGYVNALHFTSVNIALFERPPAPAGEKQEPCLNVQLHDIIKGVYKNAMFNRYQGHTEWVRRVKYSQHLECFVSCATTWDNSVVIGWMEKHTSVNQSNRMTTFQISQGVNDFDYHDSLNLIATAGVNHHVCLWNPYVVSKPNGVLRGHMASVVQVQFNPSRGQLISFSKDKVLRIWDVQLQVCIQRLAGMFPKGPEVYSTLYFDEGRNRLFITFNYQLTVLEMKAEIKDRTLSHEKPVIGAIYNSVYNQVVSVCQTGTLVMWMVDTGQKVKQFHKIHGNNEVTSLTQDPSQTRLFTGSTDGTVKMWDFNGHCYHTLECAGGQPADVGQVVVLKRCVLAIGWTKSICIFRNNNFKDYHVQPADWKGGQEHAEDILSASFQGPNLIATGSYDGEIVVWNMNSEQASRHMAHRSRRGQKIRGRTFLTAKETSGTSDGGYDSHAHPPQSQGNTRPRSRALSRVSEGSSDEQNEFGWAVAKLVFLESRKGNSASGGANLVSCGGNGWVRFWNTSHSTLLAEFVAHTHAGSIIMATDKNNHYLVTGDVDGNIKVWDITEYCLHYNEDLVTTLPPLKSQFQPHIDMINTLEICERNERLVILSASSDCSVALWDVYGNQIGVFGQEEHWKIEPYIPPSEDEVDVVEEEKEEEPEAVLEPVIDSGWEPDERAINDPDNYRVNTWESTLLGKDYQELRVKKRVRRQPNTIPNLPYLHGERTGQPPAGPYSALDTAELAQVQSLVKPDAEKYFLDRPISSEEVVQKLPALAESLKSAFDEKSLFPRYLLEFETKMKSYHEATLNADTNTQKTLKARGSFQNIGLQLGGSQKNTPSPLRKHNRSVKLKPIPMGSRRSSIIGD